MGKRFNIVISLMKCSLACVVAFWFVFASAGSSNATPTLYINGTTVASGSFITYNANEPAFAPGWNINMTMAIFSGTNGLPSMMLVLSATSLASATPVSLDISFSADSLGPTTSFYQGTSAATVTTNGGSVTTTTLFDPMNMQLAGTPLFTQSFGVGASNGDMTAFLSEPGPYALTQRVRIMHDASMMNGTTSVAYMLGPVSVPEGGKTLVLFGLACAALLIARRKLGSI